MIQDIERYLALRASLGYGDACLARILRRYGRYAEERGWQFVERKHIDQYLSIIASGRRQIAVFHMIRRFSDWMRAEDPRYQSLDAKYHGIGKAKFTLLPYIYETSEILAIIDAMPKVTKRGPESVRSLQFLIGLLAATGIRLSEALGLLREDYKGETLFIRHSKFRKQRLIGLRWSTQEQIRRYLDERDLSVTNPHLIIHAGDRTMSKQMADYNFRKATEYLGMTGKRGSGKPRLHDLRHSFAVRALEACGPDRQSIEAHLPALCAYLGHTSVRSTYHYLRLLPDRQRNLGEFSGKGDER